MKHAELSDMFKKVSKSVCSSNMVSPNPLFPTPSATSAIEDYKNTEGRDDPEPANEGDNRMEYSYD